MTERLFEQDSYLQETEAEVVAVGEDGVVLNRTVFYARGGGQPGDRGELVLPSGEVVAIADTVKGEGNRILHLPAPEASRLPEVGDTVLARIDWGETVSSHAYAHLYAPVVRTG